MFFEVEYAYNTKETIVTTTVNCMAVNLLTSALKDWQKTVQKSKDNIGGVQSVLRMPVIRKCTPLHNCIELVPREWP